MRTLAAAALIAILSATPALAQSPATTGDPAAVELKNAWDAHIAAEQRLQNAIAGYAQAQTSLQTTLQKDLIEARKLAATPAPVAAKGGKK